MAWQRGKVKGPKSPPKKIQTQLLLSRMFGENGGNTDSAPSAKPIKFFDLFCGIGGASTGAVEAGMDVVFAADNSAIALKSHAHNHPQCRHAQMTFPCEDDAIPWPAAGVDFHLHGSPPCTRLTPMQMKTEPEKIEEAVALVKWFLQLALRKSPTRWSMEQVSHPRITAILNNMKRSNRNIDYLTVDFAECQLPQHRRRLFAGPPWVVDNIRAFRSKDRYVPLGRVVPTMPPETKYIRNSLVNDTRGGGTGPRLPKRKSMRRVTRPSFTVVTTIALRFYGANKKIVRSMKISELMILQGTNSALKPFNGLTLGCACSVLVSRISFVVHVCRRHQYQRPSARSGQLRPTAHHGPRTRQAPSAPPPPSTRRARRVR